MHRRLLMWLALAYRNIDVSDTACIKYSISKALGLGLVAGGGIVKVRRLDRRKLVDVHKP